MLQGNSAANADHHNQDGDDDEQELNEEESKYIRDNHRDPHARVMREILLFYWDGKIVFHIWN
jgi:hypothetical protein